MTRTQLSFRPEELQRARARAQELGVSLAEYVRRLVTKDLEVLDPGTDPSRVFDLGRSRGSDISREKDAMVAEAFGAGRR